ncbi:MAG: DUF1634 domain-containing protein [Candidatus Sulfotelmatobacter sp.]
MESASPATVEPTTTVESASSAVLGLLLLIATPVARVGLSIFGFAEEHDSMYVVFTVIVFSILLYSLLGSA